jgi:hypothetical protein
MDALEMYESLGAFLRDLRSHGLLLTRTEFTELPSENYISKSRDIGRILGRNYMERKIRELGFTHVKVPKKTIVIDDSRTTIKFYTDTRLSIGSIHIVGVYAEKIQSSDRAITYEEASELFHLFQVTGFWDFHWENVIIAEDGVYIIDTEFRNFEDGRQYIGMSKIINALPTEQQPRLLEEFDRIIEHRHRNAAEFNRQRSLRIELEKAALKKSGCFYSPDFTFSIQELIT